MNEALFAVTVVARRQVALDIVELSLAPVNGAPLPAFTAGAHIDLHLADGLVRQYSLCNAPDELGPYRIAVLLDPQTRGGSRAVHALQVGDTLRISPPRNHFALVESSSDILLMGGGIGITPLLAMAHRLHHEGRAFTLHYCSRSPDRMAYREALLTCPFADRVHQHFDDGAVVQLLDTAAAIDAHAPGRHVYSCGPTGFLDHILSTVKAAGWPDEAVHYERFSAEIDTHGSSITVIAAKSGVTVTVPDGETIATSLAAVGVGITLSCEQGVCGTCLTRVLEGTPDHRDLYLTDSEKAANDCMTICCSRALTPRLVLDI